MNKVCTKCNKEKSIEEFNKRSDSKDGKDIYCKTCKSEMTNKWKKENPIKLKQSKKISDKKWYQNNKQRKTNTNNRWKENNTEYVKDWFSSYKKEREKLDPSFKMANKIRNRLWYALKGKNKHCKFDEYTGCSRQDLVIYLESLFEPGMTWDNYGKWEVDHREPLFKFDLTDIKQLKDACNYTNLQPIWKEDHKKKTKKDLLSSK
jgi:hypothetical protein